MWVEKLPNGKVRYVERYENPLTEKSFKVSVTMDKDTKANRKQAQIALQDKISAKVGNLLNPTKKTELTTYAFAETYLKEQEKLVKKSTLTRNTYAVHNIVKLLGSETLVDKLNASYVKSKLYGKDELPCTVNERLKRFKAMMRWGYAEELLKDVSWLDKLKPLQDKEKKKKLEEKFLESSELKLLLSNMHITKWKFIAEFSALSGMRIGEVFALENTDLDFNNRIITINKTYDYINDVTTTPKTDDSVREIYMQDQLYFLCKKIKLYMRQEQMQLNYRSKLFISNEAGEHVEYYAYNKYLKENALRIVNKKATTHFMRHTHVALMAEQGVPLDVISRRLGHADSKITKEIYFHVTEKLKQQDYDRIKDIKII